MLHALIQSKFATLEKFAEEYHLARAWRQPGPATIDVEAQVCGVDDLTEVTVKEVQEGLREPRISRPKAHRSRRAGNR